MIITCYYLLSLKVGILENIKLVYFNLLFYCLSNTLNNEDGLLITIQVNHIIVIDDPGHNKSVIKM